MRNTRRDNRIEHLEQHENDRNWSKWENQENKIPEKARRQDKRLDVEKRPNSSKTHIPSPRNFLFYIRNQAFPLLFEGMRMLKIKVVGWRVTILLYRVNQLIWSRKTKDSEIP